MTFMIYIAAAGEWMSG